jgi:hypothetical protein
MTSNTVERVFEGKDPALCATFGYLLQQLQQFGEVKVAFKQTSIHLEKNSGFAGRMMRKSIRVEIKCLAPNSSPTYPSLRLVFEHYGVA